MADENIDLQLNLDSSGFVQGANQAAAAAAQMGTAVGGAERSSSMLGKALSLVTPGRVLTGSFGAAAIAAGNFQAEMQGISATAAASGQSTARLARGVNELARSFPVGQKGAIQVVSTLQSMGLSGNKSIKTIDDLSKSYIRLGAATSTNASLIGRQMTTLNRAFGASDSNISRFNKMSDSLVGVTAKIGGSAPDILAFSKNIAPMARQAGIGQTAVMGISAAFSKMGEDGYAASNAMNKVLNDLNRSVRDGSSEMNTYANIVGKTRGEFEKLFKANPTQAVQEVLSSLAAPGAGGARNAERLGLDGTRTQRVLQGLAQQGGIASAAATAVAEYGGGSTQKASAAAMGGLGDSLTKMKDSVLEVTQALGTPFLGALTKVVDLTAAPIKGAAGVLESGAVQKAIQIAAPLALTYLGARALGGIGLGAATGRQIVNNGLVRGFREGNQMAYAGSGPVGPVTQAQAAGRLMERDANGKLVMGTYGRVTDFSTRMGQGFGQARAQFRDDRAMSRWQMYMDRGMGYDEAYDKATAPRPGIGQQLRNGLRQAPNALLNAVWGGQRAYNQAFQESARALQEDDPTYRRSRSPFRFRREDPMDPNSPATGKIGKLSENLKSAYNSAGTFSERMARVSTTLTQAGAAQLAAGGSVRTAGRIVVTSLENTAIGLKAFGSAVRASGIGGLAVSGLKGLGSLLGGTSGAVMGGLLATMQIHGAVSAESQRSKDDLNAHRDSSMSSTLDAYRDATGRASDAVQTFAEQVNSANKALGNQPKSYAQTGEVTAADQETARNTRGKVVHTYAGTAAQVAEQARAVSPRGIAAADLQGIKVDMLRQMPRAQVEQVMKLLSGDEAGSQAPSAMDFNKLLAPGSGGKGTSFWGGVGHMLHFGQGSTNTTKQQGANVELALGAIGTTRTFNEQQYGPEYARQEAGKQINAAFKAAMKTGNKELAKKVAMEGADDLGAHLSMNTFGRKLSGDVMMGRDDSNMVLTNYLAKNDKEFRAGSKGLDFAGRGGGQSATKVDSAMTTLTQGIDIFSRALSNRTQDVNTALNRTVTAFLATPGDMDKFRASLVQLNRAGGSGADSLTRVGDAALKTVRALGDATSDASKLAMASFEESYGQNERQAGFQGSRQTNRNRLGFAQQLMSSADATQDGQDRFTRGRDLAAQVRESQRQQMVGLLQAQQQFQKQAGRAEEDWLLQRGYAWTDYNKGVARAEEDFHIGRQRAERDFHIQMAQGQEDFNLSRARANRDFNKSLRRENEDAAKSMYDPFKRIQVQAVSDVGTMLVNLREQNAAMEQQAKNLNQMRKMGLNNNTIDQLGLNKSENAQQAQRTLADMVNGAASPAQLNAMVAQRMKDAGALASDSSQTDRKRQIEDFKQSLSDQNIDYAKNVKRANQAFTRSLSDQASDFERGLKRQHADFVEQLARQRLAMDTELKRQHQDIIDSQTEILGSFDTLASAVQDAMSGKAVDFRNLMKGTLQGSIDDMKALMAKYPQFFNNAGTTGAGGPADAGAHSGSGPQYVTGVGGVADSGGRSGGGSVVGDKGVSVVDRTSGDKGLAYTTAGTGAVVGGNGQSQSGADANFRPTTDFMKAHPANPEFNRSIAKSMMAQFGFKPDQFRFLDQLWTRESGWNQYADNTTSSAYGIPQSLPGTKMKGKGPDWRTNPATQIAWGLQYIKDQYKTPAQAWDHEVKSNWYAMGSIFSGPQRIGVGEAGPEAVIPLDGRGVSVLAQALTQYMTGPDAQRLLTGGHGDRITYTGNQFVYDYSTDITGPITVQSQDPNDMMRKLEAKKRQSNLTSAPQRKGGR